MVGVYVVCGVCVCVCLCASTYSLLIGPGWMRHAADERPTTLVDSFKILEILFLNV